MIAPGATQRLDRPELASMCRGQMHRYHPQPWLLARAFPAQSHSIKRLKRRGIPRASVAESLEKQDQANLFEKDKRGSERLRLQRHGWRYWSWRNNRIHYIQAGDAGPPVVLVHGFGASAYHWRFNVPELAKRHRVFAVDLLGFGWSTKDAQATYNGYQIWSDQLSAFIREVVGASPVVLVGNSLGGYSSLLTAANHPDLVQGVVVLNGAGRFEDPSSVPSEAPTTKDADSAESVKGGVRKAAGVIDTPAAGSVLGPPDKPVRAPEEASLLARILEPAQALAKKAAIYIAFLAAKQPDRIRSVLNQVYVDKRNVDQELVNSIVWAAQDPGAPEVFARVISASGESVTSILRRLRGRMPVLLLWGSQDPWIRPTSADRIQALYPRAERININAGHCPHDDSPGPVNENLLAWLAQVQEGTSGAKGGQQT